MTRVAIYTHHTRNAALHKTLWSLHEARVPVHHIETQTSSPTQVRNRRNAHAALNAIAGNEAALILEDDIVPNAHLLAWLGWLETHSRHVTTLYAPNRKFYSTTTPGLQTLQTLRGWYGAQAVWIPPHKVHDIVTDPLFTINEWHPYGPWDHAIRRHLLNRSERMNVVMPNLVQHQAPASVLPREGRRHTTPYFDAHAEPPQNGET